jgi:hypothetical protein
MDPMISRAEMTSSQILRRSFVRTGFFFGVFARSSAMEACSLDRICAFLQ